MSEQHSDQIFDYLLEEMLVGPTPPDLTARIVEAWKSENASGGEHSPSSSPNSTQKTANGDHSLTAPVNGKSKPALEASQPTTGMTPKAAPPVNGRVAAELVEVVGDEDVAGKDSAISPNKLKTSVSVSESASTTSSKNNNAGRSQLPSREPSLSKQPSMSLRRRSTAALLALMAALLLAVLGQQIFSTNDPADLDLADSNNDSPEQATGLADADKPESSANSPAAAMAEKSEGQKKEILDLDDLPFEATVAENPSQPASQQDSVPQIEQVSSEQVIAHIDRQMQSIWDSVGVQVATTLPDDALAEKIHFSLTGESIPVAMQQRLAPGSEQLTGEQLDPEAWSRFVTDSAEFPRHWASQVVRQLIRRSSLATDSEGAKRIERLVARKLADNRPWAELPRDLLGGDLGSRESESYAFVSALGGGGNHRMLRRLGSSFLNENLWCSRCHESGQGVEQGVSQADYWSMVALLKGVEAQGRPVDGLRLVSDQQTKLFAGNRPPSVFYELRNGQMKAALPVLPNGRDWESTSAASPRLALAEWLGDSPAFSKSIVNQTWKILFGRQLVPSVDALDVAAAGSRQQLLDYLADQFRAHDHDLSELVVWLTSSRAFALSPNQMSRSQWLQATDEQLDQLQLAELVFASGTTLGKSNEARSLEASLVAISGWQAKDSLQEPDATLAQPSLERPKAGNVRKPQPAAMPPLSLVLHGNRSTPAERTFVRRLLRSERLSWEQRVEHIVALSQHDYANARVQQLAKELLQQSSGDTEVALLNLLWAVQNSDAS